MIAHNGYSSKVALTLLMNDAKLQLSHVGSSKFIVRELCDPLPSGNAEIEIQVNDSTERFKVYLPHGVPAAGELVDYVDR